MYTFEDALLHLTDYLGGGAADVAVRDCKRAIAEAYRDIANAHNWTYLYAVARLYTSEPYETGTVAYDQTGGSYERVMTLTGGTWPTWAVGAYVRIGDAVARVTERKSDTVVVFDEVQNFEADIASGTTYSMYRDTYLLPADYVSQDTTIFENNFAGMSYVHPREWVYNFHYLSSYGIPSNYTVMGDTLYPGRLLLKVYPYPSTAKTIDFVYKRRPRALTITSCSTGTVSVASGQRSVVGVGTAFTHGMVGSVIRLSSNTRAPTGFTGTNLAAIESVVLAVTDATHLTLSDDATATLSAVAYTVSDPIDVEVGAMANAFLRCCEAHIGMSRTLKDKPSAANQYRTALGLARDADSRSFARRAVGGTVPYRRRFRDMPQGPDQV